MMTKECTFYGIVVEPIKGFRQKKNRNKNCCIPGLMYPVPDGHRTSD